MSIHYRTYRLRAARGWTKRYAWSCDRVLAPATSSPFAVLAPADAAAAREHAQRLAHAFDGIRAAAARSRSRSLRRFA